MKVPYSWLRTFVPDAPNVEAVADALRFSGTEVERIDHVGVPVDAFDGYKVGQVIAFEQHPNADRLRLCRVDVGLGDAQQIVCGASNFAVGDNVAVVLPGARLPDGSKLKKVKLRGIESHGMMLSERELELSQSHDGIMILDAGWDVGAPLSRYVPLGDDVLELEITSNRPDCLSVLGVAREVAAARELSLRDPVEVVDEQLGGAPDVTGAGDGALVNVRVEAPDLCPRYMARSFTGVVVGPSPAWLAALVARAGMRSINNVVDVTNYVMLLTGQPLHAFDAERIDGGELIIRSARSGEKVTTLDGVERPLPEETLLIADRAGGAVIAGIMGAERVEVTPDTTTIVLESAAFSGTSIMRSSLALGLRSESSSRFEKGLSPELPALALELATRMLVTVCNAQPQAETIDVCAQLPAAVTITLAASEVGAVLGVDVAEDVSASLLRRIGCEVEGAGGGRLRVTVPYWRADDLVRAIDLIEEIGRLYGYDKLPATLPQRRAVARGLAWPQRVERAMQDAAVGLGMSEAVTYNLVSADVNTRFAVAGAAPVKIANPMTSEHAQLATSAIGGLLGCVAHNVRAGIDDVALFELATTFQAGDDRARDGLPRFARERRVLGYCCTGKLAVARYDHPQLPVDCATAIGIAMAIARATSARIIAEPMAEPPAYLHPGAAATLKLDDAVVGWCGQLHPRIAADAGLTAEVVCGEMQVAAFVAAASQPALFKSFGLLPPVRQDIAVIVPDDVGAGDVLALARTAGGDLLERIDVFDRYTGTSIPDGHYSLALRMTFRAPDRTLTDAEVAPLRENIVAQIQATFGAQLRA